MSNKSFTALVVDQRDDKRQVEFQTLTVDDLPDGNVVVEVAYSGLNYKDGMAITGKGKILRNYPIVPGIDLSGTVVESQSPDYQPGDKVILTGWGIGENYWGGYTQMARVKSEWLVKLPEGLTLQQAMSFGTAGFTAALAVIALEDHGLKAGEREVIVTGAAGGVGSVAIALLAQAGNNVVASTGRTHEADYLTALGATSIIDRNEFADPPKRPLASERWGGAVDTVGDTTLAQLLTSMARHASIAVCGLAGGTALNTTVMPFILRGVNLLGIDSVACPLEPRTAAWERLAQLPKEHVERMTEVIPFSALQEYSEMILQGQVRGRTVVDVNA